MAAPLPRIAQVVPGLSGRGVLLADPAEFVVGALGLLTAGFVVREGQGSEVVDRAGALPALAAALGLRGAAGHNLDALADTLRDLPDDVPGTRLALLWRAAEQFIEGDPQSWDSVREILTDTSEHLRAHGFAFETVAFVEGYDVTPLLLGVPHDGGPLL